MNSNEGTKLTKAVLPSGPLPPDVLFATYPSRSAAKKKVMVLSAITLFILAVMAFSLVKGTSFRDIVALPIVALLWGGFGLSIFLGSLHKPQPRILLDPSGISEGSLGLPMIPWGEITSAKMEWAESGPHIFLQLRDPQTWLAARSNVDKILAKLDKSGSGNDVALPLSGLDQDPETIWDRFAEGFERFGPA